MHSRVLVVLFLAILSGCSSFEIVNSLVPSDDYLPTANIAYGVLPRQTLDLYRPKDAKVPAGIVIFFYGGYWQYGNKENYRFVAEALASQGYIAVLPDYRVYPSVAFPSFVEDGALAVKWTHDHAKQIGGDPSRIYLMGHSAGAHIAALLTLDGRYLKAVGMDRGDIRATVGLAGPYDFPVDHRLRAVFGATSTTQPIDPAIEPINFVDGREPPMLLINGTWDTTVEPGNATRLADRIRGMGGQVEVKLYPGAGHTAVVSRFAAPLQWLDPPVLKDSVAFFRQH